MIISGRDLKGLKEHRDYLKGRIREEKSKEFGSFGDLDNLYNELDIAEDQIEELSINSRKSLQEVDRLSELSKNKWKRRE